MTGSGVIDAPRPRLLSRGTLLVVRISLGVAVLVGLACLIAFGFRFHCLNTVNITSSGWYSNVKALLGGSLWMEGDECVGVSEPVPQLYPTFARELSSIAASNERIEQIQRADPKRQVITLVYLGILTAPHYGTASLATEREGLRGIAVAQNWQLSAPSPLSTPLIHVLAANAGQKMTYGPSVAKRVVSLAAGDRSLVGVVGLSESYLATKRTVDILSAAEIPSVGAVVSTDVFADESTGRYFEIAPQNRREADVVAAYAKRYFAAEGPAGVPVRIYRSADPDDIYSANIATDAAAAFQARGFPRPTTLTFAPDQVNVPADFAKARLAGSSWCPAKGVIFWAGRPIPDFGDFHTGLQDCGYQNGLLILADDDTTRFVADSEADRSNIGFTYASFATLPPGSAKVDRRFNTSYQDMTAAQHWDTSVSNLRDGHAALAFDTAETFTNALDQVGSPRTLTPSDMAGYIGAMTRGFEGASGRIVFGQHTHVPPDKPVLLISAVPGHRPEAVVFCGQQQEGPPIPGSGPQQTTIPCPL